MPLKKNANFLIFNDFRNFLKSSKKGFLSKNYSNLHLVMGNEAMDLDSLVCSLTYAYFLHLKNQKSQVIFLPLLNCSSKDFLTRKHLIYLLNSLSIPLDSLVFLDECNLEEIEKTNLSFHLVDHNTLSPDQFFLTNYVKTYIDHHSKGEIEYPKIEKQYLSKVGSCATLVFNLFKKNHFLFSDVRWSKLFLSSIYIDTSFLKDTSKTTNEDIEVASFFEKNSPPPIDFFKNLEKSIKDLKGLSFYQLLTRDLKKYQENLFCYGVASFPGALKIEVLKKGELEEALISLCKNKNLKIGFVLSRYSKEKHCKLFIFSPSSSLLKKVSTHLLQNSSFCTYLLQEPLKKISPNLELLHLELRAARKFIQPLLQLKDIDL
jgi:exopolyphosphatase